MSQTIIDHTSDRLAPRGRTFTGFHMLAIMLTFFGVIMAVNFTMAWLASHSWTGLVVKNSYVESQRFDGRLAEIDAQAARGWTANVVYETNADRLVFELTDGDGQAVALNDPTAKVGRPAFEQLDQRVQLSRDAHGRYVANLKLAPGLWLVQIEARERTAQVFREARLFVPQPRS